MGRRTIDVVAAGPPSSDLYDPAAPAWALAAGLAARGHAVQVAFPGPEGTPAPSATVTVAPFSPVTAHVGSFLGDAELAREAAHRLRPTAEAIVRDPAGLGALGFRHGRRPVISFLRAFADDPTAPARPGAAGVRSKLLGWGERRSVRRLQREALEEASAIFCAT
ncbi:MAG TPA: hypothetical protein VEH10_04220, partial [Thermoplasmata archaeon]|nr:hypothetical protein [Thermoplasmata archaeon]